MAPKLTLKEAKESIPASTTISYRRNEGEYRVNFRGGKEATAYYTNDLRDAVQTAISMGTPDWAKDVDWDAQDRRAYEEEKIENLRREY